MAAYKYTLPQIVNNLTATWLSGVEDSRTGEEWLAILTNIITLSPSERDQMLADIADAAEELAQDGHHPDPGALAEGWIAAELTAPAT